MIITDQKLVCLKELTGGKCKSRTQATYGFITSAECLTLGDDIETRVIGVVMFDQVKRCHVVKTASGYSDLTEWLS